jgi:hypothetical protein
MRLAMRGANHHPRALARIALTALVTTGGACDKQAAGTLPVAGIPYLDTDPLPRPPPRAAFAAARWVPVSTGHGSIPEMLTRAAPSAIGAIVETHGGTHGVRTVVGLRRLAFGRLPPPEHAVEVDPAALAKLGFEPPGPHVWLFGTEGPCRANVTVPMVGAYQGAGEILEVSWRLEGCLDLPWAPVGVVAETLPPHLQWTTAQPVFTLELGPEVEWSHPFAPLVDTPPPTEGGPVDLQGIQALEVVGPIPAPVQISRANMRHDPEVPEDLCPIEETTATTHGFWDGSAMNRFVPIVDPVDVPILLGSIVSGDEVEALVYRDGPNVAIAVPPTPPPPEPENAPQQMAEFEWGPPQWTRFVVPTGRYSAAQLDAMRWVFPLEAC